ncbi:hypothetical protein OHR68_06335 [Spirillospora sp. NBC_00431]
MAEYLVLTEYTVKAHVSCLLTKTGCRIRGQAAIPPTPQFSAKPLTSRARRGDRPHEQPALAGPCPRAKAATYQCRRVSRPSGQECLCLGTLIERNTVRPLRDRRFTATLLTVIPP